MKIKIRPVKKIVGDITVPGDKSIAHRALMIGALALVNLCQTFGVKVS